MEKGLLRETESVQEQIQALVKCDVCDHGQAVVGFKLTDVASHG